MTITTSPSPQAMEADRSIQTYVVSLTEAAYQEMSRIQAIERYAGFLDGISVSEVVQSHLEAGRLGY